MEVENIVDQEMRIWTAMKKFQGRQARVDYFREHKFKSYLKPGEVSLGRQGAAGHA